MANIASGNLTIKLDKNSDFDKNVVDEIINNLESNNHFTYQGECEGSFYDKNRTIDLIFNGKWNCDSCWEWFENQISEENKSAEISSEAKTYLINSEISGGSYEHGSQYRDRVFKKNGALKLDRYNHTKLESEWPEILDILDAYDSLANPKDKQVFLDYLVTNLKLYFDKFEDELQNTVEEPTTTEYDKAKQVTKDRMYLETMEKVLADIDKVIIDKNSGSGVVPYLPLPELGKGKVTN